MNILIIILVIIALPFIIALFLSNQYKITREITINKQKQTVFDYVKRERNHLNFNRWWLLDPHVKMEFRGTDGAVGFVAAWESDMKRGPGKGEQETIKVIEGNSLDYDLHFLKPFESTSQSQIQTESTPEGHTKVKWTFSGNRNYSQKIFHLLFQVNKMLGKELQLSLGNLKNVMER
jgi:hypothetical protein